MPDTGVADAEAPQDPVEPSIETAFIETLEELNALPASQRGLSVSLGLVPELVDADGAPRFPKLHTLWIRAATANPFELLVQGKLGGERQELDVADFAGLTSIEDLTLNNVKVHTADLPKFFGHLNLRRLTLRSVSTDTNPRITLDDEWLQRLVNWGTLQSLQLHQFDLGDGAFDRFANLPALEELSLSMPFGDPGEMAGLAALRGLRALSLELCHGHLRRVFELLSGGAKGAAGAAGGRRGGGIGGRPGGGAPGPVGGPGGGAMGGGVAKATNWLAPALRAVGSLERLETVRIGQSAVGAAELALVPKFTRMLDLRMCAYGDGAIEALAALIAGPDHKLTGLGLTVQDVPALAGRVGGTPGVPPAEALRLLDAQPWSSLRLEVAKIEQARKLLSDVAGLQSLELAVLVNPGETLKIELSGKELEFLEHLPLHTLRLHNAYSSVPDALLRSESLRSLGIVRAQWDNSWAVTWRTALAKAIGDRLVCTPF